MNNCFKRLHVISTLAFITLLMAVAFTSENPFILIVVFLCCVLVFYFSKSMSKLLSALIVFLPFFLITAAINLLFVQQGSTVLFSLGSRHFTLEALIYAIMLSSKLLMVIYIFQMLGIMMDSDRAVSYFSSIMPKSTLIFMISLKLFPLMKKRINSLKEIYSIRGVDFEGKTMREKASAYRPVLSVLLEDSLEKSFDIGEAAYVRGFLSSKRTVYDRQRFGFLDWMLTGTSLLTVIAYIILQALGCLSYDIYSGSMSNSLLNQGVILLTILFVLLYFELTYIWKRLVIR